jgi:hypothetical protein
MAAGKKVVKGIIDKLGALPDNVVDAREVFVPPPLTSSEQNLVDWARTTFKEQASGQSDREILGALTKIPEGSREHRRFMGESDELIDIKDAGGNFYEKPSRFDDITTSINSSQLKGLEEASNTKFNTYNINEVLDQPSFPLSDLKKQNLKPEDQVRGASFIIFDPAKEKRYMVNTSGADSYIRNWSNLVYD